MAKQSFDIEVIRIGYGSRTITVEAETYKEAQGLALNEAGNYDYSEKNADYELADSPSKLPMTKKYHSNGYVYGILWGGDEGIYPTKTFSADSLEELLELNKKALSDNSLDNGMGFERLLTAKLIIRTETSVIIDGLTFINNVCEYSYIGDENYIDDLDENIW